MDLIRLNGKGLSVWWLVYSAYLVISWSFVSGNTAEEIDAVIRILILTVGVYLFTKRAFVLSTAITFAAVAWLLWTPLVRVLAECMLIVLGKADLHLLIESIVGIIAGHVLSSPIYVAVPVAANLVIHRIANRER